jgi:Fe-S cluster assembly protein SufD
MIEAVQRDTTDTYLSNLRDFERGLAQGEPVWLRGVRHSAWLYFAETGFPTLRDEEWKYTNLQPLARTAFACAAGRPEISRDRLAQLRFSDLASHRLVFVNGRYAPELSDPGSLPEGVQARSLGEVLREAPEQVEQHLARYASYEDHAFTALNTAFLRDGAYLFVPAQVVVEQPIQLLFLSTSPEVPLVSHPRVLVHAGMNSQATVIETYLGLDSEAHFTNPVTELVLEEGAVVDHYRVQNESRKAFHIGGLQSYQGRSSSLTTHSISLGGLLSRNNLTAVLDGQGANCTLNGLYVLNGDQHVDNHTRLEHAQPHCSSREVYKGILDESSRGVFHGRILVRRAAQKTDSKQTNNNLLLSDHALVNTQPQLEIYADDVKCTHGATIGQLNSDALFYLRSRGIGPSAARSLLIYAFASEMIGRVKVDSLREKLDDFLFERLPRGELVREAV